MKLPARLVLAFGLALGSTLFTHATLTDRQRSTLEAFRTAYAEGLERGRPELFAPHVAEDFRLMIEMQPTVVGRANALLYYCSLGGRFSVPAYRRQIIEVLDLGSRVVEAGRFTARYMRKSDGQAYDLIGKYVDLWAKAADGGLSLVTQGWNYDQGIPIGEELRFAEVPSLVAAFQARTPLTTSARLEIAAMGLLIEKAVVQHDASLFSKCYADDAILLPNYGPAYRGRAEIDPYAVDHFAHLPVFEKLDIRNDRVDELEGFVVEYASHVANWKNGDASGVNTGKNLRIWRREPNHSLKIIVQLGAYD